MSAADRLDQIEARANAATEGPWEAYRPNPAYRIYEICSTTPQGLDETLAEVAGYNASDDADFIAHARTDVPWLIEQVRKRDAALQAVLDLHREARNDVDRTPPCPHCHGEPGVHDCGCWADEKWPTVCAVCMEGTKGASVAWPCPTVRAIKEALK